MASHVAPGIAALALGPPKERIREPGGKACDGKPAVSIAYLDGDSRAHFLRARLAGLGNTRFSHAARDALRSSGGKGVPFKTPWNAVERVLFGREGEDSGRLIRARLPP